MKMILLAGFILIVLSIGAVSASENINSRELLQLNVKIVH